MFTPANSKVVERLRTSETVVESQGMMALDGGQAGDRRLPSASEPGGPLRRRCAVSKTKVIIGLAALSLFLVVVVASVASRGSSARPGRAHFLWDSTAHLTDGQHVETMVDCGRIRGRVEDGGFAFRNVPYALPPVGRRRFRPAQRPRSPADCWSGVLPADGPAAACPHLAADGAPAGGPEACLTLDVFAPRAGRDAPLPVVVLLGGETLSGETPAALRPSARLAARHGVVFALVHVRRGVLGFLASEELAAGPPPQVAGNYGLSDLVAALEWLSLNVEHFGGSAVRVTLLGHQSGATLMTMLTALPRTKTLYTHMWLTGGSGYLDNFTLPELAMASDNNAQFLSYVGCDQAQCLRNKTATELLSAVPRVWHRIPTGLPRLNEPRHSWLVRDGALVTESVWDAWARPQLERPELPDPLLVIGANAQQDGAADLFAVRQWNTSSVAESYVATTLGSFPGQLRSQATALYLRQSCDPWTQIATMVSDVRTVCPLHAAAAAAAKHFSNRVYFYLATQKRHGNTGWIADGRSDIEAILGVYRPASPEQRRFVENMQNMFYGFVRDGRLPQDVPASREMYVVNEAITTAGGHPSCKLWRESGLYPQYARRD